MNEPIEFLTIECRALACTPRINAQGEASTLISLEGVKVFELMHEIIKSIGVNDVLEYITAHDIALYMKGENDE